MKRPAIILMLIGVLFSGFPVVDAHALDLARYMDLVPGKWKIYQRQNIIKGATGEGLYVVSADKKNSIIRALYLKDSNDNWVFFDADIYKIDKKFIYVIGYVNSSGTVEFYNPKVSIPRSMPVNHPFVYKGALGNCFQTIVLVVNQTGISQTTPAGTFTGCIKVQRYVVRCDGEAHTNTMIWAPGRMDVSDWYTEIDLENESPIDAKIRETIQYGDADPPPVQ